MEITGFELVGTEPHLTPAQLPDEGWIPAAGTGGVHESLLAAGLIDHPYRDRNESSIRWIEERDWWFRTTFPGPGALSAGQRARLVFEGLDTVVDLWFNGAPLGHHENMFRPAEFDVTGRLRESNDLLLRFSPPLAGLRVPDAVAEMGRRLGDVFAALAGDAPGGAPDEAGADGKDVGSAEAGGMPTELGIATQRRKAAFSWGWDFGPRVPSIGIWNPVHLVLESEAAVTGHHVTVERIGDGSATVGLLVEVDAFAATAPLTARVELVAPSGRTTRAELPVVDGAARGTVEVAEPELWWTHDLGEPSLYDVTVTLLVGGRALDHVADRVGLRTIALDRGSDPEGGHLFRFVLNGVPIFARGADWLPADMFVGSVSPDRHRALVGLARAANMTMLRVWGGGVYEKDSFYAACDEEGVLVWHDFMFACTDYPSDDPALAAEVTAEATYQVKRLRNRACMALWSGNNEVQLIHGFAYQGYEPGPWGWDFFHRILPEAVAAYDGHVPYWPGSPWGEDPTEGFMAVNGVLDGDRHAWEVWHGFDFGAGGGPYATVGEARHYRRYAQDRGKFVSEFGIHASPERSTLERWIPADRLAVHSPSFDHHNKDNPKDKHDAVLEIVTGLPADLDQYVDFTMVSQAEGLKFGVEHYRRRQPHCSGTLVWQLNDVWPGFSWSVIDHELVPKAAYHYLARAFAPVLASFRREGDTLELWVTNSGRASVRTDAIVTLAALDGTVDLQQRVAVDLAPAQSRLVWNRDDLPLTADRYAWVESTDGAFGPNRLFFAEVKDVPWPHAQLEVTARRTEPGVALLTVTSPEFAYFVHALTPVPGVLFNDNYVDLRADDTAVIEVTGLPDDLDPADLVIRDYRGVARR
jgi:beta-mannosidase